MDWLIGHFVGDYLLQNDWMAQKKQAGWKGFFACFIHCLLWTLAVCLFAWWWNPVVVAAVFASHWILDRTQLVKWYCEVTKKSPQAWILIVCDNVIHLAFLWVIAKWLA